jgi:hypothetical protein
VSLLAFFSIQERDMLQVEFQPNLVGSLTILKNMKINGKEYSIYYGKMCETTNQF